MDANMNTLAYAKGVLTERVPEYTVLGCMTENRASSRHG